MSERRMFSLKVVGTDWFLEMPLSTQALYFHLSMRADDDGFVDNPKTITRIIGATQNDYDLLVAKRFILEFGNGVIVIKHWKMNNYIRKDRYIPTRFKSEINSLEENDNGSYTEKKEENVWLPNGIPSGNQVVYPEFPNLNYTNSNINNSNNNILLGSNKETNEKSTPKRFVKPTIDEIRVYCDERNNGIDPVKFFNYYESVGWKIGKAPMKNWKSCVITWERKNNTDTPVDNSQQPNLGTNLGTKESSLGTKMGTSNLEEYNSLSNNAKLAFDYWYIENKNKLDNMGIFEKYDSIHLWQKELDDCISLMEGL